MPIFYFILFYFISLNEHYNHWNNLRRQSKNYSIKFVYLFIWTWKWFVNTSVQGRCHTTKSNRSVCFYPIRPRYLTMLDDSIITATDQCHSTPSPRADLVLVQWGKRCLNLLQAGLHHRKHNINFATRCYNDDVIVIWYLRLPLECASEAHLP